MTWYFPDQLLASAAQTLAGPLVHIDNLSLFVLDEQGIGRVIHIGSEAGLGRSQLFLCPFLFGHIDQCAQEFGELSRFVQNRIPDTVNVFDGSIRKLNPEVDDAPHLIAVPPPAVSCDPLAVLRMDPQQKLCYGR